MRARTTGVERRGRRRGVALVTALMVVSVATVAAVALATHLQIDIRRTSNLVDADQAMLYALGAEGWAVHVLARDRSEGNVDSLGDDWATLLPTFDVEGGTVGAWVEDLQGRFNLNALAADGSASTAAVERLRWLLEAQELDSGLADSIVDWIDADLDVFLPDGAEDDEYLNYEQPYRAGNAPMWSPSELRMVKGMTQEAFEKLIPFVTTLPGATPVNVNTAPKTVLIALMEGLTVWDGRNKTSVRVTRDQAASVADALRQQPITSLTGLINTVTSASPGTYERRSLASMRLPGALVEDFTFTL